jgi:hypothetical protein
LPVAAAAAISALNGQGVAEWLDLVLGGNLAAGSRLLDIDYGRYGEAEASLGWLNWQLRLELDVPLSPQSVVGPFLDNLDALLAKSDAAIMHLKVFDQARTGWLRASVCRNGEAPVVEGDLTVSPSDLHELVVNLRAKASPEVLTRAVGEAAKSWGGRVIVNHQESFQPLQPNPEYRFTSL